MRRPSQRPENPVLRVGAGLMGLALAAEAALAAERAVAHMASLGAICGPGPGPPAHCGWCFAAVALGLAALAALAAFAAAKAAPEA